MLDPCFALAYTIFASDCYRREIGAYIFALACLCFETFVSIPDFCSRPNPVYATDGIEVGVRSVNCNEARCNENKLCYLNYNCQNPLEARALHRTPPRELSSKILEGVLHIECALRLCLNHIFGLYYFSVAAAFVRQSSTGGQWLYTSCKVPGYYVLSCGMDNVQINYANENAYRHPFQSLRPAAVATLCCKSHVFPGVPTSFEITRLCGLEVHVLEHSRSLSERIVCDRLSREATDKE